MKHPRIPRCSLFLCIFSLAYLSIFQASDAFSSARQMISKNGFGGVSVRSNVAMTIKLLLFPSLTIFFCRVYSASILSFRVRKQLKFRTSSIKKKKKNFLLFLQYAVCCVSSFPYSYSAQW